MNLSYSHTRRNETITEAFKVVVTPITVGHVGAQIPDNIVDVYRLERSGNGQIISYDEFVEQGHTVVDITDEETELLAKWIEQEGGDHFFYLDGDLVRPVPVPSLWCDEPDE